MPLLALVRQRLDDPIVLDLVEQYLRRTVDQDCLYTTVTCGISLGCPLSPLMAALYLEPLDRRLEASGLTYARFMDDWVILAPTRWSLRRAVRMVNQTLRELRVEQHPDKTFIGRIERGFTFLGYWITERGVTGVAPSTWQAFRERVAQLYEQNAPQEEILRRIGQYVRRWKRWALSGVRESCLANLAKYNIDRQRYMCYCATALLRPWKILHQGEKIMQRKPCLAAPRLCLFFAILLNVDASAQSVITSGVTSQQDESGKPAPPNILFIIMDDVGIDQMQIFGYGGVTPPLTPNINAIALAGVRFRNVWAMPECSPSRAIFFEGRYPLRTNVFTAILSDDLANSQVSPYEVTTPQILRTKKYTSGLFGKFHLAGPDNNEFTNMTPHVLGWDYFDGFLEGAPHPIDTTLGDQPDTTDAQGNPFYTCGFVPNRARDPLHGADSGACVQPTGACAELTKSATVETPGFTCLQQGGIFVKNQACSTAINQDLDFGNDNAYYVWNRVINRPDGSVFTETARGYVSDATVSAAVDWITLQNKTKNPWMSTVSFANIHTPYQQPPQSLLPSPTPDTTGFACTGNTTANEIATRVISNQMFEAMDTEIGNLMVSTGLAGRKADGSLDYHPEDTNTMVIIIGDNGTFAPGVKVPFDSSRAKGFVYQTGVWVPLIVAGPLVVSPNREVSSMLNIADLFQLFGEIAGIDVHKVVPSSHILDSQSMLPYLTNPNQPSIRTTNFTQAGSNIHVTTPPPCVIPLTTPNTCIQLFNSKPLCNFEGGNWYGPNPDGGTSYTSCCDVQRALYPSGNLNIYPIDQQATRDDDFKLVTKHVQLCGATPKGDAVQPQSEFYQINENVPVPAIDKDGTALCEGTACPAGLTPEQAAIYQQLTSSMNATLNSEPPCIGDGNEDKVVNGQDIQNWRFFSTHGVQVEGQRPNTSSWYDFNHDGYTDQLDLNIYILPHLGTHCLKK
jgi:hypothetical protein